MEDVILIRPLHFVDIICDYGAGTERFEPHPYGHAVHIVANRMLDNKDTLLQITWDADDVCTPCIHNINGVCDNFIDRSYRPAAPPLMRDWDLLINQRWSKRLNIKEGDIFTAKELCERLRDRAGDITGIFPEILDNRIETKEKNMRKGIGKFLE